MVRCLALVFLLGLSAHAAPSRALILFDGNSDIRSEGFLSARYLTNLLGHFEVTAELRPIAGYRKGDTESYSYVFFAGTTARTVLPQSFLDDVARTETPVIWLGRHIEQLVGQGPADPGARRFGFRFVDYEDDDFETVVYRNMRLPKGDPDLSLVTVQDPQRVRVHATALRSNGVPYPYVLQRENFWYIADSPFSFANEGDRYLVFCDLLHDIFADVGGTSHRTSRRAMVRIEDVSVDSDPQELRAVADYLYSQRVPFQIALYPVFKDPQKGLEIHLADRPDIAEAVRYMVARGGAVVLHGITHQYQGVSGDDFELWNDFKDSPINSDTSERLERKLEMAFRECFSSGIYPLAWETPHNAGSPVDYQTLGKYFTVFHERVLAGPALASEQYFPYPVRDTYGRLIVPENLGFLKVGETDTQPVVDHARAMLAVRDGVAGFYFHPFLKLEYLKRMVGGIRALGYEFISLREFNPRVSFRNWRVEVASDSGPVAGAAALAGPSGYVRRVVLSATGATLEDAVVRADQAAAPAPRGALLALESAAGPRKATDRSIGARFRGWLQTVTRQEPAAVRPGLQPSQALILWNSAALGPEAVEQQAFENVFRTYGIAARRLEVREFRHVPEDSLLVIPAAVAPRLLPAQEDGVLAGLRGGQRLLLAGRSNLASRLGIQFAGRRLSVVQATDLNHPERFLRWPSDAQVERFEPPDDVVPLILDPQSRQLLAFSGQFEQGSYLFLAAPLDSRNSFGLTRYPYLAQHLEEVFRYRPRAVRPRLEVYFDPGFHPNMDLNRLVNSWRKSGIRLVHVAAWQFYPKYTFDYRKLIDLCHRQGIATYAWFELPMVTKKFWDQHPEWREKTASGADAQVGWRYLMNLYNPDARLATVTFVRELVENEDWDGVNLAEMNFDAADNFMDPAKFVPMNADVRQEFRRRQGFDPAELFQAGSRHHWGRAPRDLEAFLNFRVEMVTTLHRTLLEELEPVRKKKGLEIVVTMLDSLHSPRIRRQIGVDSLELVKLMDRFPFTLQVEDPSEFWAASPERYREFGRTYRALVKDPARLMFDINVVADRNVASSELPSQLATGTEFARLLLAASAPTGRAAIYSEWTVTPQDWQWAGAVLASETRVTSYDGADVWKVDGPRAVALRIPRDVRAIFLDGKQWPVVEEGSVLIPAGKHLLTFSRPSRLGSWMDVEQLQARLHSISGELLDADVTRRGLEFSYDSPGRCLAVFNKQPYRVRVDGREWSSVPLYSRGEWALVLPAGRHSVDVVANETAVFVVEVASLFSSWLIVAFGTVSCGAMAGLYAFVRLQRVARQWRRWKA